MRKILTLLAMGSTMLLGACSSMRLDSYRDTQPVMSFDRFFNGPVQGWGMVQDRSGQVIKRFDVSMLGTWHGDAGTLDEDFTYYDGKKMHRTWYIHKVGPGQFVGRADDIIGDAPGHSLGTAIEWNYVMRVDADGKKYDVTFDDWMFQMNDGVIMNRSYMSKFGIGVGEITVFMQKKSAP